MKVFSILLLSLLLCEQAQAAGPEAFFLVKGAHQSNLFKRPPEPTVDSVQLGATVVIGNFEVDLTHGWTTRDCPQIRSCDWRPATEIVGRWYPFKGRR